MMKLFIVQGRAQSRARPAGSSFYNINQKPGPTWARFWAKPAGLTPSTSTILHTIGIWWSRLLKICKVWPNFWPKFWPKFDRSLTQFWPKFDPILTKVWPNFDPSFDPILTQVGPYYHKRLRASVGRASPIWEKSFVFKNQRPGFNPAPKVELWLIGVNFVPYEWSSPPPRGGGVKIIYSPPFF
jgi:hypothetical protein